MLPSGRQTTFANRVHWSKSYLGKAGLIAMSGRGRFTITDRGRDVLIAPPSRIDIKFLQRFPSSSASATTQAATLTRVRPLHRLAASSQMNRP